MRGLASTGAPESTGAPAFPVEVELKFTVLDSEAIRAIVEDPAVALPGARSAGPAHLRLVEDRYVDTADRRLEAAGLVARIRAGGPVAQLTIKSLALRRDGAIHARMELESEAGDGDDPWSWPASAARDLLLATVGEAPLATLAVLRQRRYQRDVTIGSSVVELSLDEIGVTGRTGRTDAWVELECELRSGTEEDLATIGAALARRLDLAAATSSKLKRALAVDDPSLTDR
jgi:inorganic triphosphatase YgiF